MENLEKNKPELTDKDLGLETEPKKTVTKETSKSVKKTNDALKNAAATAALKAAIDANNEISEKEAERTYIKEKMNFMLDKCKHDEKVKFRGDKIYARYFGKIYSYTYNGIPVVVKFDGSVQEFPKFVYENLMKKIHDASEANTPKVVIEDRTGE